MTTLLLSCRFAVSTCIQDSLLQDYPVATRHYAAIFIVALAVVAVQVLASRVVSVTFYYHFAFAGITFAMLGLTAGALKVYAWPERLSLNQIDARLAGHAVRFGILLALAAWLHMVAPGVLGEGFPRLMPHFTLLKNCCAIASVLAVLAAFIDSGVCIALLLTRFPARVGRLYACDLIGAALGCIAVILLLRWLDPLTALLLIATAAALTGWTLLPAGSGYRLTMGVRLGAVLLAVLCTVQVGSAMHGAPLLRLRWNKNWLINTQPFEHWNSYSRITVSGDALTPAFGWGMSITQPERVHLRWLIIDAAAATVITAFDGDLAKIQYLKDDVINLGYNIRSVKSVAVIGVGGGRDILSALVYGAAHITGLEMNPATLGALTQTFGDYSGHLDRLPGVSLVNDEARSYLDSHPDRYDLIQISLIDTWAATAAGGLTLSENKLYTTDAWNDFLDRLNDDGMLVVSRWYTGAGGYPYPGEFYRMLAIAGDVLHERDPSGDPRRHLLAARGGGVVTLAVSNSPFSDDEVARFKAACAQYRFTPLLTPDMAPDAIATTLASGQADAAFFDHLPLDETPPTDDRPFFFNMSRPANLLHAAQRTAVLNDFNNQAIVTLMVVTFIAIVAGAIFIGWPLMRLYRHQQMRLNEIGLPLVYFAGIGLGFMLIEVALMQRLMVFLGHPVYGLSVVLFTLLLSSGIGSFWQQQSGARAWKPALALCLVLLIAGLLAPVVTEYLKYDDNAVRIAASALLIAPLGIFMGRMFPAGVALVGEGQAALLPWYWGVNGAASVLASVAGVLLSLELGISLTFWCGVTCYVVCLGVALSSKRR